MRASLPARRQVTRDFALTLAHPPTHAGPSPKLRRLNQPALNRVSPADQAVLPVPGVVPASVGLEVPVGVVAEKLEAGISSASAAQSLPRGAFFDVSCTSRMRNSIVLLIPTGLHPVSIRWLTSGLRTDGWLNLVLHSSMSYRTVKVSAGLTHSFTRQHPLESVRA